MSSLLLISPFRWLLTILVSQIILYKLFWHPLRLVAWYLTAKRRQNILFLINAYRLMHLLLDLIQVFDVDLFAVGPLLFGDFVEQVGLSVLQ